MFKLLYWLRSFKSPHKTIAATHELEGSLNNSARQLQAIDPETDKQWNLLKAEIETGLSSSHDNRPAISKSFLKPAVSFAIAGLLIIAVGVIWFRHSSIKIYTTAKGQHSNITLQDSTEVTLNYKSELTINHWPFEKARHAALKGEALFNVRKNGTPFILTTDVGTIQVLGTRFNVRVRDNNIEVGVINGSVKLSVNRNGFDSSIVLIKGQIAVCSKNDFPEIPGTLPFTEYPGWTRGKFMFYRTSLTAACKEVESQFDIRIKIEKSHLQNETFTGVINGESIETTLTTLAQLTGSKYRYENGAYVIY